MIFTRFELSLWLNRCSVHGKSPKEILFRGEQNSFMHHLMRLLLRKNRDHNNAVFIPINLHTGNLFPKEDWNILCNINQYHVIISNIPAFKCMFLCFCRHNIQCVEKYTCLCAHRDKLLCMSIYSMQFASQFSYEACLRIQTWLYGKTVYA